MKKLLLAGLVIFTFQFYSCEDGGSNYRLTTDYSGFAQEFLKIPANGKIRIIDIDALCSEVEKGGKFYKTHYLFMLREFTTILDCDCGNFQPTEFVNVEKGDRIKLVIKHGEVDSKYNFKYEFVEAK